MKYTEAKAQLTHIAADIYETKLKRAVAEMLIDEAEGYEVFDSFLSDLFEHGCQSGIISSLIFYTDTHSFFDEHYEDIEELRQTLEEDHGTPIVIKGDLKNFLAWLAFEETAMEIGDDLGIEL